MLQMKGQLQKLLKEREMERINYCKVVQQLRVAKDQETVKLQQALKGQDQSLVKSQRLQHELCQLQQQMKSTKMAIRDQVVLNNILPVLRQAHDELISTTSSLRISIDELQNGRLASYSSGSGVVQEHLSDQAGHLGTLDSNSRH